MKLSGASNSSRGCGMPKQLPSVERLREAFAYDPLTGALTWRTKVARSVVVGNQAGCARSDGYHTVRLDGVQMLVHRVIWAIVTGAWPQERIDHEDTDPGNNRWVNLREAPHWGNMANRSVMPNNHLGIKGIRQRGDKFLASITINCRQIHLGTYSTEQDAADAYAEAATLAFGQFARVS